MMVLRNIADKRRVDKERKEGIREQLKQGVLGKVQRSQLQGRVAVTETRPGKLRSEVSTRDRDGGQRRKGKAKEKVERQLYPLTL